MRRRLGARRQFTRGRNRQKISEPVRLLFAWEAPLCSSSHCYALLALVLSSGVLFLPAAVALHLPLAPPPSPRRTFLFVVAELRRDLCCQQHPLPYNSTHPPTVSPPAVVTRRFIILHLRGKASDAFIFPSNPPPNDVFVYAQLVFCLILFRSNYISVFARTCVCTSEAPFGATPVFSPTKRVWAVMSDGPPLLPVLPTLSQLGISHVKFAELYGNCFACAASCMTQMYAVKLCSIICYNTGYAQASLSVSVLDYILDVVCSQWSMINLLWTGLVVGGLKGSETSLRADSIVTKRCTPPPNLRRWAGAGNLCFWEPTNELE